MSRTLTLAQIRTLARQHADQELNSEFVTDAELDAYINASYGIWHGMVAKADPERFGAEDTITATGASSYALPADYLATLALDYYDGSEYTPLFRSGISERNQFPNTTSDQAQAYRFWAGNIILMPNPSSGTYRHLYVTHADVLSDDADTVDGVNGWESWIYLDAAVKMMIKEESDPSALMAERNRIQGEVEAAAQDRDFGNAYRVVDVRTRFGHGPRYNRWGMHMPGDYNE